MTACRVIHVSYVLAMPHLVYSYCVSGEGPFEYLWQLVLYFAADLKWAHFKGRDCTRPESLQMTAVVKVSLVCCDDLYTLILCMTALDRVRPSLAWLCSVF